MRQRVCTLALALAVLTGCPEAKPKGDLPPLHPTKGTVIRGSQAVSGGLIQFLAEPMVPDLVVNAEVRADGTFELQTLHSVSLKKEKGAPAGTYQVNYLPPQGDQTQGASGGSVALPKKVTIVEGPNDLTIDLGKK